MRAWGIVVGLMLLLSGCATMEIDEKSFIRPDKRSGWVKKKDLTPAVLEQQFGGVRVEPVQLSTSDGFQLNGIRAVADSQAPTILYFGGNMFHLDDAGDAVLGLARSCKANWVSFDYRGYGRSQGDPQIALMKQDALAIYDQVRAQTKGRILVHGHSLGSFIAAYVAGQRTLDGLVLESTATNALDWANANLPWYLKPFIEIQISESLKPIDNTFEVQKHRGAALVMVGDRDQVTPAYLGEKVWEAMASTNKRFYVANGGGHDGLMTSANGRGAQEAYCGFVQANP